MFFLRVLKFPPHPLYFDKVPTCLMLSTSVELLFNTVVPVLLIWKSLEKICQVKQEKLHHQQKSNLQTDLSIFRTPAPKHWAKQRELSCRSINMSVSCLLKLTGLMLYAWKTAFFFLKGPIDETKGMAIPGDAKLCFWEPWGFWEGIIWS